MDYIQFAINNPVKVAVGVILVLLFGLLALFAIPIQLTPDVDQPVITVETTWVGRSPEEVEREIVEEQEDKLKSIANLKKMTATSRQGGSEIRLEFYVGASLDRALRDVSNKLREVPEYPPDVDEPVVTAADTADANAIAWLVLTSSDPAFDIQGFYDTADKRIKPILERVEGISKINLYGGREREVHIQVNPRSLASRGITFNQLRQALQQENVNVSAGEIAEPGGRMNLRVRTIGQYDNLEDIRQTIVASSEGGPVRVADLAEVELTLAKRRSFVRSNGRPAMAFQVTREVGANVMEVMAELRERITQVQRDVLPRYGDHLELKQVYDETVYIDDAIALVQGNLVVGGSLAIIILMLFLRTIRPTMVIALAIPISVIGTFVVMAGLGRNINVISLAGLAFAVGMVVDNAIVVLENIDRHLNMGKSTHRAAYDAAREVWGAILASTLTTLAVFIPVIFMEEEAGQLFRDIAIAMCAAVSLSLLVSVTVIPSASARWLRMRQEKPTGVKAAAKQLFGVAPVLASFTSGMGRLIYALTNPNAAGIASRVAIVVLFTAAAVGGAAWLMPPTTYLPKGNQNLVFGMMFNPPGYNVDFVEQIGERVESVVLPYYQAENYQQTDEIAKRRPIVDFQTQQPLTHIPPIENFFFVTFQNNVFMGAASSDKQNVAPLGPLLADAMSSTTAGAYGFAQQSSIFGMGAEGSNAVEIELSSPDLATLRTSSEQLHMRLMGKYGPTQVRPTPSNYNLPGPELQVKIDRVRAKDVGVDVASLGLGVQALVDGAIIGDYRYEGDSIELLLTRSNEYPLTPDNIGEVPLAVTQGQAGGTSIVPLSAIADVGKTMAPQEITRIEQLRSISLSVMVPDNVPLEQASSEVEALIAELREQNLIAPEVETRLAGTADKLTQVRAAMLGDWKGSLGTQVASLVTSRLFLALLVTYLLMAALFESFLYPLVIMFSVPLAAVGGFAGLAIVHYFQPSQLLDVVTMLGFVILIGVVVNNAILIVHQSLNFMRGFGESEQDVREPLPPRKAIAESVRTRIRPIMMTTATSVFGMLPLVIAPGAGSELYRGLGSVVLGGLVVSTLFTLIVVPLLLSLVIDAKMAFAKLRGVEATAVTVPEHAV